MKLDHIGLVARDLEATSNAFIKLGYAPMYEKFLHHGPKNMYVNRVRLNDFIIEIMAVADASKPSFIDEALDSSSEKVSFHHFCWLVDDMRAEFDRLLATGHFTVHEDITGTVVTPGNKIGFLKHENLRWIEFLQRVKPLVLPAIDPPPEIKLGHLGYVTRDIEATSNAFLELGLQPMYESFRHHGPRNMMVNRVTLAGLEIEIMSVADKSQPSFIDPTLAMLNAPSGLEHISYMTKDIYKTAYNMITFGGCATRNPIQSSYLYPQNKGTVLTNGLTGLVELSNRGA